MLGYKKEKVISVVVHSSKSPNCINLLIGNTTIIIRWCLYQPETNPIKSIKTRIILQSSSEIFLILTVCVYIN